MAKQDFHFGFVAGLAYLRRVFYPDNHMIIRTHCAYGFFTIGISVICFMGGMYLAAISEINYFEKYQPVWVSLSTFSAVFLVSMLTMIIARIAITNA